MIKKTLIILVVATASLAHAQVFNLSATDDTRILSVFPSNNFGGDILSTFNGPGNLQRTAMLFDVSGISSTSTVTSAKLRLFGNTFSGGNETQNVSVFRVNNNWVESQATWLNRATATPWNNAGGDYVGTTGTQATNAYSVTTISGGPTGQWFEFDVTNLVQEWVSGTHVNQGMMLVGSAPASFVYRQSEATNGNTPELVINADPIPEPATISALALAIFAARQRKRQS